VKIFVTGGTGFIGQALVRRLRERGDQVVTLVRSPERAGALREMGADLAAGGMDDADSLRTAMAGSDAVLHVAGVYKVGIPESEHPAMYDANVRGTEHVLDAAIAENIPKIVYVSTVNVFGNTKGRVVDETYRRNEADGFLSYYDETKYRAHLIAEDRIAKGAPIVIAMPSGVYGPGDHSEIGTQLDQLRQGKLRARSFPELGFSFVYVDDVAEGIVLALDRGVVGESYVLGGEVTRLGNVIDLAGRLLGRKPPRFTIPAWAARMSIPIAPLVTRVMGTAPNLAELIRSADGVTYWATEAKARRDLGYAPRNVEAGLRRTFGLDGSGAAPA
jgi:dihydroflavonol-4-reductase